ncbi:MFS transporter, partial [Streptomyces sp. NPDC087850]
MDQVIPPAAPGSVTDVISSAGAPAGTRAVEDVQHSAHGEHTGPAATPPGFVPKVFLAQFGLFGALMTPVLVTMALRVAEVDPDNKTSSLSLVLGVGAIFALIANPLVGRLSDRTTSRLGRRRPWLIGGVVGGLTGLALIAFVPSIPVILLGWIITQICYNASLATLQATVPDQVAHRDRGKVSGALGVALTLAIVVSATLAGQVADARVQFLVPAVLAIVLVGCFAVTMEDKPLATAPEPFSVKEFAGSFWTNPVEHRDFGWAW